jgi:predicted small lipoprotein YifL
MRRREDRSDVSVVASAAGALASAAIGLLLAGCGQKGPLIAATPAPAAAAIAPVMVPPAASGPTPALR